MVMTKCRYAKFTCSLMKRKIILKGDFKMEENKNMMMDSMIGMDVEEVGKLMGVELELVDVEDVVSNNSGNAGKALAGVVIGGVAIGLGVIAYHKLLKPAAEKASDKLYDKYHAFKAKRDAKLREQFEDEESEVVEVEVED